MTSNDRNLVTSNKPGTVLLMQNADLGHTKVIQIRQRETLNHQRAIIHENCCSEAQYHYTQYEFNGNLGCHVRSEGYKIRKILAKNEHNRKKLLYLSRSAE